MAKPIRFGVQTPPQNTTFAEMRDTWKLIDQLGYDTAWTFDHFFPILSDPSGPCFEGWVSLTALMAATSHVKAGILVTGNTYRNPAVLASMGKTLDHASDGRLIMGIGAGWFEQEHTAYDVPFYTVGERIRRLDEACEIIKRLWTEKQVNFDGRYYHIKDAYCEPKPVQKPHPPVMIGGGGEKLTLRVVAKHADIWNTFGPPQVFRDKLSVLRAHCKAVGRNFDEIEVSWAGSAAITQSREQKEAVVQAISKAFGRSPEDVEPGLLIGSAEEIRDGIAKLIEAGVTHFILIASAPFNHDMLRQFAKDVIPHFK
ncbi:MAG TPA: TIGR03560 family F420-dependent LLM class oxidoreductase [Blastocatellia bacterium]|nr:TIGR03560 family F420-dependent LLM class oxidoreductase [Blastocatellia bacterium]